LIDLISFLF